MEEQRTFRQSSLGVRSKNQLSRTRSLGHLGRGIRRQTITHQIVISLGGQSSAARSVFQLRQLSPDGLLAYAIITCRDRPRLSVLPPPLSLIRRIFVCEFQMRISAPRVGRLLSVASWPQSPFGRSPGRLGPAVGWCPLNRSQVSSTWMAGDSALY